MQYTPVNSGPFSFNPTLSWAFTADFNEGCVYSLTQQLGHSLISKYNIVSLLSFDTHFFFKVV